MFLRLIAPFLILVTIITNLLGCASLSDIRQVRDLPDMTKPASNEQFYYDPSIRSYRVKESRGTTGSSGNGRTIRDAVGKKVQTESELERILQSNKRELIGRGTQITTIVLMVFYIPIAVPVAIVESVIMIPWSLMITHIQRTYESEAEQSYKLGREHFANDRIEQALAEWEHARTIMPSLQAFSDIDYWRGRAFQEAGKFAEAQVVYLNFINYSEQSVPGYFKETFSQDPSWEEKAKDAESRLTTLRTSNPN